jgi:signal peptide peptidase SppA
MTGVPDEVLGVNIKQGLTLNPAGWRDAPFVEQWLGHWAMREQEFQLLADKMRGFNLSVHLDSQAARDAAKPNQEAMQGSYTRDAEGVATIEIRGRMQKQPAGSMGQAAATVGLRRAVRAACADDEVGSILLILDSPGGTIAGTAELAADVGAAAKVKPVFGLAEDMCCSACYWVGAQCSELLTQSSAMVGSIGTYGVVYDQSAAAAQEGVKVHVIRAGDMKGVGTPGTEVTTQQLLELQNEINSLNDVFLSGIASGREMPLDKVKELATGQVWIGQQAVDAGLADGVASIDQAMQKARAASAKTLALKRSSKSLRKEVGNMAAATYQEIVGACIGATPDFICEQIKAGASVEQSTKDWMTHQQLQIEAGRKELDKVKADAKTAVDAAEAKAKLPGNVPLGGHGTEAVTGDLTTGGSTLAEFRAKIDEKVAKGMKRQKAVAAVVREHPELQKAVIAEAEEVKRRAPIAS